ncbi:hypothetical protein H0H93_013472 [Arthromyces matolae]|nr:hypothetical protein H0H93_013472 [Arthromyces matolae]
MPQRFDLVEDGLSLRHIPDASDTSFQIPNALFSDDRLLDDASFLRDIDDVPTTSTPGPNQFNILTLEDLTPRPTSKQTMTHMTSGGMKSSVQGPQNSRIGLPKGKLNAMEETIKQKVKRVDESNPSGTTRLDTLRVEMQMLDNDILAPNPSIPIENEPPHEDKLKSQSTRTESPVMKSERQPSKAVSSGGVVKKPRNKGASSSGMTPDVVSVPASHPKALVLETRTSQLSENADIAQRENPDDSVYSMTAPGGVAERLLMYSQTLLPSYEYEIEDPVGSFSVENNERPATLGAPNAVFPTQGDPALSPEFDAKDDVGYHTHTRDDPLTLSQISPSKADNSPPTIGAPAHVPPSSPMKQSTKRPGSELSRQVPAKKGKGPAFVASVPAPAISRPVSQSRAPSASLNSSSTSRNLQRATRRTRHAPGQNKKPVQEPAPAITERTNATQNKVLGGQSTSSRPNFSSTSKGQHFSRLNTRSTSATSVPVQMREEASSSTSTSQRHNRVVLPPANPTKCVEFKFQVDARIEARKADFEKEKSRSSQRPRQQHNDNHVPGSKEIHSALQGTIRRKENIAPTVPMPFRLTTHTRAHEREKFDEHVREKDRELQRVLEQKRREEEEIEEREIRELRKKAVPKAHEVPEWYKDVPKRKVGRVLEASRD